MKWRGAPPTAYRAPDLAAWVKKLEGSSVVGRPGDFKPLILDKSNRLYLRRYWEYETALARRISERAASAPQVDHALLREGLARLFPATSNDEVDWQKLAAFTAVAKNLSIISGGPVRGRRARSW